MTATIAIPTFVGGAKDTLAALDIYKEAGDDIVNSIQEEYLGELAPLSDNALLELVGGDAMAQAASEALAALPAGGLPTEADVLAQVQGVTPAIASGLRDMTSGGAASMLGGIQSAIGGAVGGLKATIGGVTSTITGAFRDVAAVSSMINNLAGTVVATVRNVQGMASSLSSIVTRASNMGFPNSFGAVMAYPGIVAQMGNQASQVIGGVVRSTFATVARVGDLGSISSMASAMGPGGLATIIPNPVNLVARTYNAPAGSTLSDYEQACATAQSSFDQMQPGWNQASFGGASVPSITALQGASPDFRSVLRVGAILSGSSTQKLQLLAGAFPGAGSAMSALTRSFPQSVIRTVVDLGTVDPRVAATSIPDINRQSLQAGVTNLDSADVNRQSLQAGIEQSVRTDSESTQDPWADLVMRNETPGYTPPVENPYPTLGDRRIFFNGTQVN